MSDRNLVRRLDTVEAHLTDDEASVARTYVDNVQTAGILSLELLVNAVGDPNTELAIRLIGCRLLAWLGDRGASTGLERALENAEDEGLLWEAARALARLHAEQAIPTLLRVLDRGSPARQAA